MKSPHSVRAAIVRAALLTVCFSASASAALETAGSLLIDLDAADFRTSDGIWPQHTATGIPGLFSKQATGTPQLQTVAGKLSLVLDGDGDYLVGPSTTAALHGLNATHSVEYWVYQGHIRAEEAIISWAARGTPNGSHAGFRYGSSGGSGAAGRWGGPDMGFAAPHLGGPAVGQWHLITVTYDGTTQRVYVDGVLNASEAASLDAKDSAPIYIGTERNTDGTDAGRALQFSGAISKVRVHSGALTAVQVKNNYDLEAPAHPGITTAALARAPLHRWSFSEAAGPAANGAVLADSVGGLTAVIRGEGAVLTGTGVTLPGGLPATLPPYIDLPNGLISSKQRVTFETWVTQTSTQSGSRMVVFSKSNLGEINTPGNVPAFSGTESIALHANAGGNPNMRLERVGGTNPNGGNGRTSENATTLNTQVHYAVVYDPDFKEWRSYRNGYLMETLPETQGPTSIGDVNSWLGRSDYAADSGFAGTFDEFRIYNYTLSESEIRGNTVAGPDTLTSAAAASFAWTPTSGGTYAFNNAGGQDNWDPGTAFPDAAGSTANLVANIDGDQTVELNTTATVGNLSFGDTDGSHTFTLAPGTGGVLDFNGGAGFSASFTQSATSAANFITAPLLFSSDTELANTGSSVLTISGALSGAGKLAKSGTGPVVLTADNSAYTASIAVNGGALRVGDGGTTGIPGSGPVNLSDEGTLAINRSDAFNLNLNISGSGTLNAMGSGRLTNTGTVNLGGTTGALLVSPGASFSNQGSFTTTLGNIDGELVSDQPGTLVTGDLTIGNLTGTASVMKLSAGTVDAASIVVARNAGTSGVILQTGGSLLDRTAGADCLVGGTNNASKDVWGAYRMSGGTLTTTNHFQVGGQGIGIMEVFGDAVVNFNGGFPSIGRYQNPGFSRGRGLLDVRGNGAVNQTVFNNRLTIGEKGTGTLNIRDGGTVNLTGGLNVGAGGAADPGDGTVNLMPGGTLIAQTIARSGSFGTGRFNFHGGTLKARGNQPGVNQNEFINNINSALVWAGGAVIDTDGFTVRSNQAFSDPTGNGVASIPVTNGGSGYLAPPYIEIVGSGAGATAIANLTNGVVTSITITNPGTDYDGLPTVNVLGGGAGSGLALGEPTLAANVAGSFLKTGPGTLSLNGSSFYTGPTRVGQGTLLINGDHYSATGTVTVDAGATLGGIATLGGDVEVNGTINPGRLDNDLTTGVLTVMGDVTFNAGSAFAVDIADAQFPSCDSLLVEGTLDISKAALQVKIGAAATQLPYTIATCGSLIGNFVSVPAGTTVVYHPDSIEITAVGTPYLTWLGSYFPNETDPAIIGADADPDHDGFSNAQEFALGGKPNDAGDNAKAFPFTVDSSDTGTAKELLLTIAVLEGTPAFEGTPSPTASAGGYTYKIQGSTDLAGFTSAVSVVNPVTTDLAPAPSGYEYRSFKLDASDGLPTRGFLRVDVTAAP